METKQNEKLRGNQNRRGKFLSEEQKKIRREKMGQNANSKRRIKIIDVDTNIAYDSISDAAQKNGIPISTAIYCVRYGVRTKKGKLFVKA